MKKRKPLTPEQRERRVAQQRQQRANRTPEQRERVREKDRERARERRSTAEQRERLAAQQRERRKNASPEQREKMLAKMRERYANLTPAQRALRAAKQRERNTNMCADMVDAATSMQAGACAICRRPFNATRKACADHCHTSGTPRGLLCAHCNRGIGLFADDPSRLIAAAEYLAAPPLGIL